MASSSSSSSSVVARLKNWIWVRQHSDIPESHSSIESFRRTTELLVPEEIHGRVVLYDVFISHRGSDGKVHAHIIHENFERLGVKSFFDVEGIFKGENLSAIIVEAIKYSTVFLVLLTKGFAESGWCLEELRLMLEKVKEEGNTAELVPVFYDVEPGDLKNLKNGPFGKAFQRHKKGKEFDSAMIKRWEETLKELADVPGPCLSNFKGRDKLFKSVVKYVVRRVKNVDMEVAKYPIAIDQRVHELDVLITGAKSVSSSPCIIGIVGMTGVGKSTLAKKLFNLYRTSQSSFRSSLFVDDIAQKSRSIGLASIQKMILKELVLSDADIHNVSHGIKLLKKLLKGTEVLLVLDGVDDNSQLKALMFPEVLSSGSIILVSTPDILLFEGFPNALVYFVKKLERHHSRELLLRHAMQKPESTYPELDVLIEKYLDFCDGVPLSLEVIGRSLSGVTNKFYWKNTLVKVCDILPEEIKRRFRYYFETLSQVHKDAVLDIACFFDGENQDIIISFWDALNLSGLNILSELQLKNALSSDHGRVYIHSQLKQFVLQALEEENKDPAHIRRVWRPSDVQKALEQRFGFTNIKYLSLVVKGSQWSSLPDSNITRSTVTWRVKDGVNLGAWPSECFTKMSDLKLLMLEGSCIRGDLSNVPEGILWLRWRFYPYKFLPLELPIRNLRVLELDRGKLSELWTTSEVYKLPSQLRHLHLQGCTNLRSLPVSIGMLPYLQVIVLQGCESLTTLPEEICNSRSLCYLNLSDCSGLEYLPPNIGDLKKLHHLNMSGCWKLCALPDSFGGLSSLVVLDLSNCWNLMTLPLSVGSLTQLTSLNLFGSGIFNRQSQAQSKIIEAAKGFFLIVEMINLQNLMLSVKGFTRLPDIFGEFLSLVELKIQGPNLVELPSSLGCLSALADLCLDDCFNIRDLFPSFGALEKLKNLRISSCGLIELPEEIGELCNLETFYIRKCESLLSLPTSIGNLSKLKELELVGNSTLSISHDSCLNLTLLTRLVINECKISDECLSRIFTHLKSLKELKLQQLSNSCIQFSVDTLPNLISLSIVSCNNLVEFEVSPKLRMLEIVSCLNVKLIDVPTGITMWLRELTLSHCQELSVIRSINMLQNLEKIDTVGCANLHHIQGLELIKTLKEIHIFITYWGFTYHGDEWLLALQKNIYAPAMHFATKMVPSVDQIFRNFHKMEHHSNNLLMFQLPESTVPCSWIMIAFISHDNYEEGAATLKHLREKARAGERERNVFINDQYMSDSVFRRGSITLSLYSGASIETSLHEYPGASAGSTIHFSIFTGDSLVCEQLTSNAIVSISSNFSINLGSGWIRMLSIDEESNIETIQSEFFEDLREEKERDLRAVADIEKNFFSLLLQRREEIKLQRQVEYTNITEHEEENTATDLPRLKITTRSIADMQCFQALDIANCRIMRFYSLLTVPIQREHLAPKTHKQDLFNLCYTDKSLSHLQLEIGTGTEVANAILGTHNTVVQVTVGEDFDCFPNIITHEFIHAEKEEEEEAFIRNSSGFQRIVFERFLNIEKLRPAFEELEVRQKMENHIQFFADEEGIGMIIR